MSQNYISIFYGNEDRSESIKLQNFDSPKLAAEFLRKVAKNIEQFKTGKDYRGSDKSIFEGIELK